MKKFKVPPPDEKPKDRMIAFRLPDENYQKLKELNPKISHTLRYIIEVYLHEIANNEERYSEWNRKV